MELAPQIARILGGKPYLKRVVRSEFDLMELANEGIPSRSFASVLQHTGFNQETIVAALGIPRATLLRHLNEDRLSPAESEKTVRFARIFAAAEEIFDGDGEKARKWLERSNRGLGGNVPLQLLSSEIGARQVELALGRIGEGVFG